MKRFLFPFLLLVSICKGAGLVGGTLSPVPYILTASNINAAGGVLSSSLTTNVVINTNLISGQKYTNNYGTPITVNFGVTLTISTTPGVSVMQLVSEGWRTNVVAQPDGVGVLGGVVTNTTSLYVETNATYYGTNISAGANNSAGLVGGQILIPGSRFEGDAPTFEQTTNIASTVFLQQLAIYQPTNTITIFEHHAPITTVLNSASNVNDNTLWDYGLVKLMHGPAATSNCLDYWFWIPTQADVANTNIWLDISITRSGVSAIDMNYDMDSANVPNLSAASIFTVGAAQRITNTFNSVGTGFRTEVYTLALGGYVSQTNCLSKGQLRRLRISRNGDSAGDVNTSAIYIPSVTFRYKDAP